MHCKFMDQLRTNLATKHIHCFLILVSLSALVFAYVAEYGFQILPCDFCLYERGVYMAVIVAALISLNWSVISDQRGIFLQLLILTVGLALTFYHVGMEQHWWAGPAICTGAGQAASFEEYRAQLMKTNRPRCDQITWALFGISATAWNLMLQGGLAFLTSLGLYLPSNKRN